MSMAKSEGSGFRRYGFFVVLVAAAMVITWFGMDYFAQELKPRELAASLKSGTLLPQAKPLQPFFLTDQYGRPFTLANLRGHWTFLVIGYTACPDVCPTLMATFKAIDQLITPEGAKPAADFLFVSVDPERDSPEQLRRYLSYFNPRFLGATGPDEALHGLTGQLGLLYRRVEGEKTSLGYLIDHSASMLLIDPEAALSAIFSSPQDPQLVAEDFETIKSRYESSLNSGARLNTMPSSDTGRLSK
jgi:protein SCO1/2